MTALGLNELPAFLQIRGDLDIDLGAPSEDPPAGAPEDRPGPQPVHGTLLPAKRRTSRRQARKLNRSSVSIRAPGVP